MHIIFLITVLSPCFDFFPLFFYTMSRIRKDHIIYLSAVTCCRNCQSNSNVDAHTVNQLFFATTLFRDLPEMNMFAATNFCYQALSTPIFYYNHMANTSSRGKKYSREFLHSNKSWFTVHARTSIEDCLTVLSVCVYGDF